MKLKRYMTHTEPNGKIGVGSKVRVDLYNGTSLSEVEEIQGYNHLIFNNGHTAGNTQTIYIALS